MSEQRTSLIPAIVGLLVGTAVFCVTTFVVVDQAGGTKVESDYSNTPNAVVPGPPAFK
jgi:hypothetical protein